MGFFTAENALGLFNAGAEKTKLSHFLGALCDLCGKKGIYPVFRFLGFFLLSLLLEKIFSFTLSSIDSQLGGAFGS